MNTNLLSNNQIFSIKSGSIKKNLLSALTILALVLTLLQPVYKAQAVDICTGDGTITTLSDPVGVGKISSVTNSSTLDRTSTANLVANGDFTTEPAGLSTDIYYWGPNGTNQKYTPAINTGIPQWNRSGGGTATYAIWTKRNPSASGPTLVNPPTNGQSNGRVYFGNGIVSSFSDIPRFNAEGYSTSQYTLNPGTNLGTATTPPAIDQNVTLVPGITYRLHFSQGTEAILNSFGVAAIEISGYDRIYFQVEKGNKEYYLQFVATTAQTNIKFLSWGHLNVASGETYSPPLTETPIAVTKRKMAKGTAKTAFLTTATAHNFTVFDRILVSGVGTNYNGIFSPFMSSEITTNSFSYLPTTYVAEAETSAPNGATVAKIAAGGLSSELVLDDVIINACSYAAATPAPTAVNDAQSSAWDTNQTYSPLSNDSSDASTTLDSSTLKLCPTDATPRYNSTNCTLNSVTIAGQGVYTISGTSVTFNPDESFFGVVSTPVRYVVADQLAQYASATITPTIGPKATPDTLSLAAGTSGTFTGITGIGGLATGANLNTSGTFLCGAGETATACTATSVTITGVGVYTLNQATGVVTLAAAANATAGTKVAITYVVTDSTGLKASSTLTPTIAVLPPAPTAVNDAQSSAWDTDQTYSPMSNDSSDTSTALSTVKFKLCSAGAASPFRESNCSLTTLTIAGQGVYTLSGTNVVFNPDATFFGTVSTPARYVIADGFNQFASATITPTIGPRATPDTLTLAAGGTASFDAITGLDGLATGANLNTTRTYLCGAGQVAPSCTETATVTVAGVGVYTLNQSTGVVTLVADAKATPGTKASLTYVVTDSTGMTASSTLTPTIPGPPSSAPSFVVDPPVARPDTSSGPFQQVQTFGILGNDSASTGSYLVNSFVRFCGTGQTAPNCNLTTLTIAGQGTFVANADGTVTFTPTSTFFGNVTSINYQITDNSAQVASSTITVIVGPPPASVATPDTTSNFKGIVQNANLLTNDKAGTGLTLDAATLKFCALTETVPNCTATSVTIAGQGTYAVGTSGNVTFTPEANFVGTATALPYVVKDSAGRTVNSTYTPIVKDNPSASPDASSGPFQQVQKLSILGNDKASTGATLVPGTVRLCALTETPPSCTASAVEIANQGVFLLGPDGLVTFTPTKTFTGTATTISYQVADSSGQIASSTITVTVGPPPVPPKAIDDFRTTPMSVPVTLDPTPNDVQGSSPLVSKTVRLCTQSEAIGTCTSTSVTNSTGTFTVDANTGLVTFTPTPGWTGVSKVPYIVRDSSDLIAPAFITITITPPAYLKLKELAWTGPKVTTVAHKPAAVPASSAGTGKQIATMRIPRLGSNWQQTVFNGISEKFLANGLGYYPGTALPGALGNFAVAGHRVTQGHPFRELDQLVEGDPIAVQVGNTVYVYKVINSKIVNPADIREIFPVPGNPNAIATKSMLTLTTCHPKHSAKKRLVVHAVLDSILDASTAPAQYKARS